MRVPDDDRTKKRPIEPCGGEVLPMRIVALVATLVLVPESLSGDVLAQALTATFRGDAFHDTSPPLRDLVGSAYRPEGAAPAGA